jgi:hypothetical protein
MPLGRRKPKNYSYAYSKYITDRDDILGLIAYSLFKAAKVEKCRNHREQFGSDLDDDSAKKWSDEHSTDHYVQLYRGKAADLIANYGQLVLDRARPEIAREIKQAELENIKTILLGLTGLKGLLSNIATGFTASVVFIGAGYLIISVNQGKSPWPFSELLKQPAERSTPKPPPEGSAPRRPTGSEVVNAKIISRIVF